MTSPEVKQFWRATITSAALVLVAAMPAFAQAPAPLRSTVFPADSARSRKTGATIQRSLVDTVTATFSKLEMHESTIQAGTVPHPPHRHGHEEMILVRSGVIEVFFGPETHKAGPGDVVFMASNEMHGIRNPGPGPATYLVMRLDTHDAPADAKP